MAVRRRTDSAPDAWWVDFRVGGKRYQYTVRAKDEAEAMELEAGLRANAGRRDGLGKWPLEAAGRDRHRDPWTRLLQNARTRARQAGVPFDLTRKQMEKLAARASGHCEITGLPFSWDWREGARRRPFAPSIDRLVPGLGYVFDNVRLVCVAVNVAINEWGEETFAQIAQAYLGRQSFLRFMAANSNRNGNAGANPLMDRGNSWSASSL